MGCDVKLDWEAMPGEHTGLSATGCDARIPCKNKAVARWAAQQLVNGNGANGPDLLHKLLTYSGFDAHPIRNDANAMIAVLLDLLEQE